ncbi:beta-galactosidase YesZ [mine drainage metagenome]|uniref:beta-galactosidase n=1 Tax=mine drainage metagenome TaxID=410659 RepID=A0A1J5RFW2_9ZZZZ
MKDLPPRSPVGKTVLAAATAALACFAAGPSRAAVAEPPPATRLYHGVAYYPELWPEKDVDRDITEMKKLGINVVRMGEFAWAKMEPDEGRTNFDFFRRVMDKLHAAGIGVVLCTPTAAPPIWLTYEHPERCFVDQEGHVMIHGARQHASYDDPAVRAACFHIVEAEARALGRHPALIAWQIDNELKCHVAEDFNPSSIRAWHAWLAKRYGTIDALNAAWGTEVWSERYQAFDQVPAPLRTPFLHNASLSTAYRMCSRERIAEFMDDQSAIIRRYSDAPITHNMSRGFSINVERMCQNLDFASFDDYPSADQWKNLVLDCDLFRGAKPGLPFWVMETSAIHNGSLVNYATTHPPGFLVAEAVSCYALGSESFCYWLWRQQRTGAELPHSAIESAWYEPTLGYGEVKKVDEARRELQPLLIASRPAPAQAAVTWSDLGRAMLQTEPLGGRRGEPVDYEAGFADWHNLLLDAGLHRGVRFEGASLDGLKLLVTPLMPYVSPEFLGRIEQFVRGGGIWICGPVTGTRTAEHTVPLDGGLGAVGKLAGVDVVYSYPISDTGGTGEAFGLKATLGGWCSVLKPASPDTRQVGTIGGEWASGLGFITERRLGAGAIVVIAAQPEGAAGRALLLRVIDHYAAQAGVTERYRTTDGTIVCPRVMGDGTRLWIAVNMDGRGGEITLPGPAVDALSGSAVPAGVVKLPPYGWRALKL